jgi:hypothetical protein
MRRIPVTLVVVSSVLMLASCSASSSSTASGTGNVATPAAATSPATIAPTAPAPTSASAATTAMDPCQLVTSAEASALAGTTYGAGQEETFSGGGKKCVYGSATKNVFTVEAAAATDAAAAQAQWSATQAQAKALVSTKLPPGVQATLDTSNVAGLGDRAATLFGSMSLGGQTIGFSGIYVLKGATFFAFQDLVVGQAPPSAAAMTTQAQTVLTRIP